MMVVVWQVAATRIIDYPDNHEIVMSDINQADAEALLSELIDHVGVQRYGEHHPAW